MTTCRRGDLVVVEVRFSDAAGAKRRPAVVVSSDDFQRGLPDMLVCPVSSQPRHLRRPGPGDIAIRPWKSVGLRFPSAVRISKLLAVDKKIVVRVLGRLPQETMSEVDAALRGALQLR